MDALAQINNVSQSLGESRNRSRVAESFTLAIAGLSLFWLLLFAAADNGFFSREISPDVARNAPEIAAETSLKGIEPIHIQHSDRCSESYLCSIHADKSAA